MYLFVVPVDIGMDVLSSEKTGNNAFILASHLRHLKYTFTNVKNLLPTHLVPTHLVSTFCHLLLLFTHNLLQIRTTSLHTFIKENKYLENGIGFIRIKPIV